MKIEHLNQIRALLTQVGPIDITVAVSSDSSGDVCDCLENKAQGNDVIADELDPTTSWADLIALLLNNGAELAALANKGSPEANNAALFDEIVGPSILSSLGEADELVVRRIWDKVRRALLNGKITKE